MSTKSLQMISCGCQFMWGLAAGHEVYSVGSNFFGKLGVGMDGGSSPTPLRVEALDKEAITHVSCGASFVWARTLKGEVWSVGSNMSGELGIGASHSIAVPQKIDQSSFDGRAVNVIRCCGATAWAHCEDDKVYVCGNNEHGQMGTGTKEGTNTPLLVDQWSDQKLEMVAAPHCYSSESAYFLLNTTAAEEDQDEAGQDE